MFKKSFKIKFEVFLLVVRENCSAPIRKHYHGSRGRKHNLNIA